MDMIALQLATADSHSRKGENGMRLNRRRSVQNTSSLPWNVTGIARNIFVVVSG